MLQRPLFGPELWMPTLCTPPVTPSLFYSLFFKLSVGVERVEGGSLT